MRILATLSERGRKQSAHDKQENPRVQVVRILVLREVFFGSSVGIKIH